MSMFRTKRDVDRHVQDTFRKLKSEEERNNRCYNIAKLYYNVGEYEATRRYVSSYLAVREDSPTAHKLFGQALEALGQKDKALAQYKCSLELNVKQQDLILKVCELIVATGTQLDIGRARYWCDRAEELFPHHPTVFSLKEHLLSATGEEDASKLEALILSEINARPTDVALRIRLLRLFLDNNRVQNAYEHAREIETRAAFRGEITWYECLRDVFLAYKEGFSSQLAWEFYAQYSAVMERIAVLSMQEQPYPGVKRSLQDCVQAVFLLDQTLHQASQEKVPPSEQRYYEEYFTHLRGQLCLHLATLMLKRAKKEQSTWRETCRVAAPLLLGALAPPPDLQVPWLLHLSESLKSSFQLWAREAAFRRSQAGHVVLGLIRETRTQFLEHVARFCSGNWRERIYQRLFTARDHHHAIVTSHFVNHESFVRPALELPSPADLRPNDEVSQTLYPGALHHQVWLGLQAVASAQKANKPVDFRCRLFTSLQLTCANLQSAGIETLNRLDIDTFLYAAVLCSEAMHESHQASGYWARDRPPTLPAHISDQLCSVAQSEWWTAAHRVYSADYQSELGTLRQTLQQGIEVVRAIGNHGLDARLMVRLATMLSDRASNLASRADSPSTEIDAIEARAALYWSAALPLLERMALKQVVHLPDKRLFAYEGKDLLSSELENLIQDGRLYLAVQRMKHKEYEQALQEFNALKSPHASFHASQIYTTLASDELRSQPREAITSEMRSKHIILLTKARDSIYLTLDRLNNPGVDKKHPLTALVDKAVEEIESKLNRIDPDVYRNDGGREGSECESISDVQSAGDHNSLAGNGSLYPLLLTPRHNRKSSTPYRSPHKTNNHPDADYRRTETRPSPERLDAQIRQLTQIVSDRDAVVQTVLDQYKMLLNSQLDTNKSILAELQCIKTSMEEFTEVKKQIQVLQKETMKLRRTQMNFTQAQLPPDLAMAGEKEDELYVFDDDDYTDLYAEEANMAAAQLGQYPPFTPYPNYSNLRQNTIDGTVFQMTGLMGTSTVTYGQPPDAAQPPLHLPPNINSFFRNVDPALLYQPALAGYYGHGALPFSEGQKLPDFRPPHLLPQPPPVLPPHVMPPPPEQKLLVTTAPVNVVITSSDVMPTSAPAHQPTLSVTIPPQHRLGTVVHPPPQPLETPHAFQISMPPQAPLHMATQLEKQSAALSPVLPISVSNLLVSVPSPLYSAVAAEKTPPKGFGGAGSANNSFGGSPPKNTSRGDQRLSTSSLAEEDDHDAYPDFQPVIPLPAEVAANTGEEGEEILFEARGKLYRFVEKEWKERGVGQIKFLRSKTTGKVRLLMRREQVLKICANHLITPEMELTSMNNRAWIWVANDFADEQVRLEKLCVRFKTVEEALNFKDAFDQAREISKTAVTPVKSGTEAQSLDRGSATTSEVKVPQKPVSKFEPLSKSPIAAPKLGNMFGGTGSPSPVRSPKINVGGFTFASPPTFKADHSASIDKIIEEVSKSPDKIAEIPKVSPFAGFTFTTSTPEQTKKPDSTKPMIFGSQIVAVTKLQDAKVKDEVKPLPKKDDSGVMFATSKTDLSFTDLAGGDFTFKKDTSFKGFAGAGQSVFGSSPAAKKNEDGDNESTEEFVPTAEFAPVIPLPELVTVKTGEEDEEVLFEERAKLLRFDVETKQWKERGIGKFKLLLDPKTGKVRLLQRREQVLKVCCNHMLTAQMEFTPLKTSDKAFSWYAQDYSEGEVKPELFALRFKTVEQAIHFKSVLDTTQAKMVDDRLPVAGAMCLACQSPNAGDLSHSVSCPKYEVQVDTAYNWTLHGDHPKRLDTKTTEKPPLSQMFKPKMGSWECKSCYTRNEENQKQCIACESPNPNAKTTSSTKPLSELFKPKTGSWECNGCYTRNDANTLACVACQVAKPGHDAVQTKPEVPKTTLQFGPPKTKTPGAVPLSELFKPKQGSWECKDCYTRNDGNKMVCPACKAPKPGGDEETIQSTSATGSTLTFKPSPATGSFNLGSVATPPSTGFTFGIQQTDPTKFSFGIPSTTVVATTTPVKTTTTKSDFSFSTPTKTGTSLLGSSPAVPFKFETKPTTGAFLFGSSEPSATPASKPVDTTSTTSFTFGTKTEVETKPDVTSSFSFGTSMPIAIPLADTTKSTDTSGPNFTFGSPGKFEFHFQPKSPKSPGRLTSGGEDSDSEPEGDEGDHIYFQPVIPLPDKVPVCTGEEDEDVLYCHRAKLYRYITGEWKERGVGDFKLLRHKSTRKIRLLMRRDQILKICLNHYLSPELSFLPKDDKTWLWSAADFSEGTVQNEQFALRFKTPDIAVEFKDALDKAMAELCTDGQSVVTSPSDVTPTTTSVLAPSSADGPRISPAMKAFSFTQPSFASQSPGAFSLSNQFGGAATTPVSVVRSLFGGSPQQTTPQQNVPIDLTQDPDVVFVEEVLQVTPEEKEAALRLQLPANFYAYRYKPACPGCVGCEPDTDSAQPTQQKPPASQTPTLTELLKSAPSDVSKQHTTSLFAAQKAATPLFGQQAQITSFQSATPIFGQSTFQIPTTANPVFGMKKPEESATAKPSLFMSAASTMKVPTSESFSGIESKFASPITSFSFQTPTTKGFGFEAARPAAETNGFAALAATQSTETPEAEMVPFLPVDSKLSFATIASSSQQPAFKTDSNTNFTWSGAGTTLFGGASPQTPKSTVTSAVSPGGTPTTPAGDDGVAGGEDDTHDPQFEPIIALPDAIEVRTGEEDELKLFSHRAMLYRYQASTKEWKERGTGEIKILKHPVNNTYRLLMRREQIYKVVLNQLVTTDIEMRPMLTSDRAWCWAAYNHAEEPATTEELAVRFKYPETAKEFHETLQKCIQEINERLAAGLATVCGEEDDDEDGGDELEYEDYDDEATEIMFEKRATVQVQRTRHDGWEDVGMGELQVVSVFQDDQPFLMVNIALDGMAASAKPQMLSHIDHDTVLDLNKKTCSWTFTDYDDGSIKTYMAKFSSESAAGEFFTVLSESTSHYSIGQEDD